MIKVDLKDFFHSIDETRVYEVLHGIGYPALVAFEMARICTRVVETSRTTTTSSQYSIEAYQPGRAGILPQGAPTSGALANRVALSLDHRLDEIAAERRMVYTRYADDLTFSTAHDLGHTEARSSLTSIRRAVEAEEFRVNDNKTRVFPPGSAKYLLGLLVLQDRVALTRSFKREVERALHGSAKYGIPSYAASAGFVSNLGFVNHVSGKLAYASAIDARWAEQAHRRWDLVLGRSTPSF